MSAQDLTEQVLRDIHIMLSRCETYDEAAGEIIVNKKELLEHLKQLSVSIEGIMDECDLTKRERDAVERETRRKTEEMVQEANHKVEDVYAASMLYTEEALHRVQEIMQTAADSVKQVYDTMNVQLQKEKQIVRTNQSELKGHLQDLADSDKYLRIIEERNKEIRKEKENEAKEQSAAAISAAKPEIRINEEYFEKAGVSLEEEGAKEISEDTKESVIPEISVNLDADYFKWKEEGEALKETEKEKKTEKFSLFGRRLK